MGHCCYDSGEFVSTWRALQYQCPVLAVLFLAFHHRLREAGGVLVVLAAFVALSAWQLKEEGERISPGNWDGGGPPSPVSKPSCASSANIASRGMMVCVAVDCLLVVACVFSLDTKELAPQNLGTCKLGSEEGDGGDREANGKVIHKYSAGVEANSLPGILDPSLLARFSLY